MIGEKREALKYMGEKESESSQNYTSHTFLVWKVPRLLHSISDVTDRSPSHQYNSTPTSSISHFRGQVKDIVIETFHSRDKKLR